MSKEKETKKENRGGARRKPHPEFGLSKGRNIALYDKDVEDIHRLSGKEKLSDGVRELIRIAEIIKKK